VDFKLPADKDDWTTVLTTADPDASEETIDADEYRLSPRSLVVLRSGTPA
jgi:glycogen operon protein